MPSSLYYACIYICVISGGANPLGGGSAAVPKSFRGLRQVLKIKLYTTMTKIFSNTIYYLRQIHIFNTYKNKLIYYVNMLYYVI